MRSFILKASALISLTLVLTVMLSGCTALYVLFTPFEELTHVEYVQELSGLDITDSIIVREEDSHGGFLGDGTLIVKFDCTEISDSVLQQTQHWNALPLSKNLRLIMYGGSEYGINFDGYNLAEEYGIPHIENGCYYFWDRHSESTDRTSDTNLFSRGSYNFSLLLYDSEKCILYLFEFDT